MKILAYKLVLLSLFLSQQNISVAQTNTTHKLQMGIVLSSGINFNKMSTKIANGRLGTDLTVGMNIIKNWNDNLGFVTGFEFDFSRIKYSFNDSMYYFFNDAKILTKTDEIQKANVFKLNERTQTPIYLSIPTMFVFRTDYIGYNRYFAKFGMRHSFTLKSTTNDMGYIVGTSEIIQQSNMELPSDLSIYKGSIGISGGMEWNYYGSSTMLFELGYYYGINNIHTSDALIGTDKDKNRSLFMKQDKTYYTSIQNTQNQLLIKISLLF